MITTCAVAVFCAFCMSLAFQMALHWVIANRRAPVGHWHFKLRRIACWVALRFGIASNVVGTFGIAVWHCGLALRLALRHEHYVRYVFCQQDDIWTGQWNALLIFYKVPKQI